MEELGWVTSLNSVTSKSFSFETLQLIHYITYKKKKKKKIDTLYTCIYKECMRKCEKHANEDAQGL